MCRVSNAADMPLLPPEAEMRRVMHIVSVFSLTWSSGMGLLRLEQSMPARRVRSAASESSTR